MVETLHDLKLMLLRSEIVQKRIYASVGIPFKGNFSLLRHGARKESARSCNPLTQGTPSFGLFLTQGTPSFGLFAPLLPIFDHFEPSLQPVMGGCCKMFQLHSIKRQLPSLFPLLNFNDAILPSTQNMSTARSGAFAT